MTYTTHSDPTFLENLIPLAKRWQGPISVAIYSPGSDFEMAINAVNYFSNCLPDSYLVRDFVTFHFFFEVKHSPEQQIYDENQLKNLKPDCLKIPETEEASTYRKVSNLTYPVNVGRNVARETALTYFILPSDIELYPNPGTVSLVFF